MADLTQRGNRVDPRKDFPPSDAAKPGFSNPNLNAPDRTRPFAKPKPGAMKPFGQQQVSLRLQDSIDAATLVSTELNRWMNQLEPLYDLADQLWAKWYGKPVDSSKNPFLASMQVPYGMHAVEVILPRILGDEPQLAYRPIDDENDDLVATMMGKVATVQLARMNFHLNAREFIRQALVTGFSVAKVGWVRQQHLVDGSHNETHPLFPENPGLGFTQVEIPHQTVEVARNEPFFETIRLRDFVWPLTAKSLDEAGAVWQRRWVTLTHLEEKEQQGVYRNIDQLSGIDSSRWLESFSPQFSDQGLSPQTPDGPDPMNPDHAMIEVWERWADDRLTVVASRKIVIRDEANPFEHKRKPFVDFTPIPRPFQMHGVGVMSIIDDSNEHLNTLMRQVCDAITFTINPMWKKTEGVQTTDIVHIPGGSVTVTDGEDILPMQVPTVDLSGAMALRQAILEDMQRTTGAFELIGGAFPFQGSRTATGMSTIVQEGARRITEMLEVFNRRAMTRFGWLLMRMNEQFLDQDTLVTIDDDPKAQAAWQSWQQQQQGFAGRVAQKAGLGSFFQKSLETGMTISVPPELLRAKGILEPIPIVGTDKTTNETQKQSAATQFLQAIAPLIANPQTAGQIDGKALVDYIGQQFAVPKDIRDKILTPDQVAQMSRVTDALGGAPTTSGPGGGSNASMGGVAGAPGAAGPSGPPTAPGGK